MNEVVFLTSNVIITVITTASAGITAVITNTKTVITAVISDTEVSYYEGLKVVVVHSTGGNDGLRLEVDRIHFLTSFN